jgi:hypothetical protein
MGGIATDSGRGGRRSLDSEINMIPMIDLLMVTVSFLLITAVWSSMARVSADTQVPGPPTGGEEVVVPRLHVRALAESFHLEWKRGAEVLSTRDIVRPPPGRVAIANGARSGPAFVRSRRSFAPTQAARHRTANGLSKRCCTPQAKCVTRN